MGSVEILSENMSDKVAKNILRGRDRMVRQKKKKSAIESFQCLSKSSLGASTRI